MKHLPAVWAQSVGVLIAAGGRSGRSSGSCSGAASGSTRPRRRRSLSAPHGTSPPRQTATMGTAPTPFPALGLSSSASRAWPVQRTGQTCRHLLSTSQLLMTGLPLPALARRHLAVHPLPVSALTCYGTTVRSSPQTSEVRSLSTLGHRRSPVSGDDSDQEAPEKRKGKRKHKGRSPAASDSDASDHKVSCVDLTAAQIFQIHCHSHVALTAYSTQPGLAA